MRGGITVTDVVASSGADRKDESELGGLGRRHGGCRGARAVLGVHPAQHEIGQDLLRDFRWIDAPRDRAFARRHRRVASRRRGRLAAYLETTPPTRQANQILS